MMINGNKMLIASLLERTLEILKGRLSMRTLGNYRSSINKVRTFAGEAWNRLTMEEITKHWAIHSTDYIRTTTHMGNTHARGRTPR